MLQSSFRALLPVLIVLSTLILVACSGSKPAIPAGIPQLSAGPQFTSDGTVSGWPSALPTDGVQPWERVDAAGMVIPGGDARRVSAIDLNSEFVPGVERFLDGGLAEDKGEACALTSVTGSLSYAVYRVPLGGDEPGVVSVDANVTAGDGYFVGLADYGRDAWEWHGPFSDNHIRLSVARSGSADYTSSLGNVFVSVAAYDSAIADVVGIGINRAAPADTTAPPAPSTPTVTPVTGGLLLEWLPVTAGDLAGYRVYYASQWFFDGQGAGVQVVQSLEGMTVHLLGDRSAQTFVRISAVDFSGNESALSDIVSAAPLAGPAPAVSMMLSAPSCLRDDPILLTVSGADTYDYDIDGDGIYDSTGNATPSTAIVTSATGIIRPHVRAYNGGVMTACGGVSLVVTGNTRPVASATADPPMGETELQVTFTGIGEDIEDEPSELTYAWDIDGDGIYEPNTDETLIIVGYVMPNLYNAKFRVTDSGGAWDVDTVPVLVTGLNLMNDPPVASVGVEHDVVSTGQLVTFNAAQSHDSDGSIALYEWDFNGDGAWDASGTGPIVNHTYTTQFAYNMQVRVTDDEGAQATATRQIIVTHGPWTGRGHDSLHTGRSQNLGPQTNTQQWKFPTGGMVVSSPAVGADGVIYVGGYDQYLYALKPDGGMKWSNQLPSNIDSSPAIAADGTVYIGCHNHYLYAYNPDGILKWKTDLGQTITSSPTVGPDGTIYVGSYTHRLYAINPDGSIKWNFLTGSTVWSCPAIGTDGTIYLSALDLNFYAIYPDGSQKWLYHTGEEIWSSPAIGRDGTIYFGCNNQNLYALDPDGGLVWTYPAGGQIFSSPALGEDGTIYFGCYDGALYALNPDGSEQWLYPTGGPITSSPAIGSDGTIYVGSNDGNVYAVKPTGLEKWTFTIGSLIESSPAIGANGVVYIGAYDYWLYAIGP